MAAAPRIRIALLINQVDGDYQSPIWHAVHDVCARRDCDLSIFAGKAPFSPLEEEIQHNTIYKLVRSELFDGMIVTSGTLANYIGKEAFGDFCAEFTGLPMVSISLHMENMATVDIDNYGGMKDIVSHLVIHHSLKKIAFIRGPQTNRDAEERYRAYVDVLTGAGLGVIDDLVYSGDFREFTARSAIRFWLDEKKIIPDAIVAANDEMAMAAYDELGRRGFRIPEDIRITGFDDLEAVSCLDPPFTTVSQPLYEQGETAANLLIDSFFAKRDDNREVSLAGKVVTLSARLVVRRSCGCVSFEQDGTPAVHDDAIGTDGLFADLSPVAAGHVPDLRSALERELGGESGALFSVLKSVLSGRNRLNGSLTRWQKALYLLKDGYAGERRVAADAVIMRCLILLGELLAPGAGEEKMRMARVLNSLSLIDARLGKAFSVPRFTESLSEILFVSGITEAYLCLYHAAADELHGSGWELPGRTRLAMACDETGVRLSGNNWQSFPSADILPASFFYGDNRKTLVFLPLFFSDMHFGYLALSSGGNDDLVYEALRARISAAFYRVQLFRREKRFEEKLRSALAILQKSEERYREMAILLPSVIIETDRALTVSFINQAGREAFGISDSDLNRGVSLSGFAHPDDLGRLSEYRERILGGESVGTSEFRLVKNDATRTILLGKAQPVLQNNLITGFRWGVMDLKPYIAQAMAADDDFFRKYRFSPREKEVLTFILRGSKIRDISGSLFISESTVKGHITSIYSKIGIKNREELFELIKDNQVNRNGYESFISSMLVKLFPN